MEQAFGHLASSGTSASASCSGPGDHIPSHRKHAAAVRMAARLGLELGEDRVVHSLYSLESGQTAATKLLAAGATAIVCASDPLALGAIRAVRRAGLRVPEDVSVIGYDDSALMNCTEPPLTTVRQPIEAMGRMVIELLMRQMSSDELDRRRAVLRARARRAVVDRARAALTTSAGRASRGSGVSKPALATRGSRDARCGRLLDRAPNPARSAGNEQVALATSRNRPQANV